MPLAQEIKSTIDRIESSEGVVGTIIVRDDGTQEHSNIDPTVCQRYVKTMKMLMELARSAVREIDPKGEDELEFFRVQLGKKEFLAAREDNFMAIVVQHLK
jgi:predicted regulator of Ras-like GTPase activity (Roadblock/LC7/MglB family)